MYLHEVPISGGVLSEMLISLDFDGLVRVRAHGHKVGDTLHGRAGGDDMNTFTYSNYETACKFKELPYKVYGPIAPSFLSTKCSDKTNSHIL